MQLIYGATTITIRDPSLKLTSGYEPKQSIVETETGAIKVYDYGVKAKYFMFTWEMMPETDKNALENFIVNTVNFAELPFTLVYDGNTYTVRCMNFPKPIRIAPQIWQCSLDVRVEV